MPGQVPGAITYAGPIFAGVTLPSEVGRFRDIRRGWMQTLRSVLQARDVLAEWKRSVQAFNGDTYPPTKEKIDAAFWETVCAGEHQSSPSLPSAARTSERLMRRKNIALTGVPHTFDFFGGFYATLIFFLVLLRNDPVVEHRLQGRYVLNRRW